MLSDTQQLISALNNPRLYDHPVANVEIIETHISWVILTGAYAYKIKKPVDLGFLNFSTLSSRKHYCELELKLNKRLAPDYYLDVVAITGTHKNPEFRSEVSDDTDVIEYALKMVQFPQENELDRELAAGNLDEHAMNLIAEKIADFHQTIDIANSEQNFGDLNHIFQPALNCYTEILKKISDENDIQRVEKLRNWSSSSFEKLKQTFILRKQDGFIRECHGDLHLRNIAIVNEKVVAFDCIEFNEDLRWNDLMSEIAFLVMDLDDHQEPALASCFLNRYLELTGDYPGLKVFRYYLVYRAIVRAMVCCIRLSQADISAHERASEYTEFLKYITLAEKYTANPETALFIMHGLSGSGKTTASQILLQAFSAIRIRSDIERKRLSGLNEKQRDKQGLGKGIYSSRSGKQTYDRLYQLAEQLLDAGFSVIVDATFLKRRQRKEFEKLADIKNINYRIFHCYAPGSVMQNRLIQRNKQNKDASDADITVLQHQIEQDEDFSTEEKTQLVEINTEEKITKETLKVH